MSTLVVACVTGQLSCEGIITEAAELAMAFEAELSVVHVAKIGADILGNPDEGAALEFLYEKCREHGADLNIQRAENTLETLIGFIAKSGADIVVLGNTRQSAQRDIVSALKTRLPDMEFHVVNSAG